MNPVGKLLVVDDEPVPRENLCLFLKGIGYEVLEASHGEEGLETCIRHRPDLVLLDINLPGRNGFEICRSLMSVPELRKTPVIFLSGLMETRDKLEAFASGGIDYVSKPYHFKEVEARVRTHLALRRQQQQLEESKIQLQDALTASRHANRKLIEVNERLRQSEELKSHFIANMRNEIHDPLGSVLGLAEEICDSRIPLEQCRALASTIKKEASHLEFELRNIFCAAELEAGEASPMISRVDVDSLLRDAVEAFAGNAQEKAQTISIEGFGTGRSFATDAGKVRILLANLLANAIEFSPQGSQVELRAFQLGKDLILEVEDHGLGLTDAERSLIFDRFRQLDVGYTRGHGGQGLGLAVVKALVDLLEGEIRVESQLGQGSTFTIQLPEGALPDGAGSSSFDGNLFIFDEPREL